MEKTTETGLELDERPDLHRRGWFWQTTLWILFAAFIAAGSIGVFGGGPVAQRTEGQKGSHAWIEYDRFARRMAPMQLELHWKAPSTGVSVVQIPVRYLRHFHAEAIDPQPAAVSVHQDMIQYSFAGNGFVTVIFHLKPETVGTLSDSLQLPGQTFSLHHFIYP